MIFFDFLYYFIFRFYSDYNEKGAASSSAGIVGGFQALNILTGLMLYQLFFRKEVHINKLLVVFLFIVFQIWTYYRYVYKDDRSTEVMEKNWASKSAAFRKQMNTVLFLYAAISIIGCFGLAVYIGGRN
ncbi:MAG: hypothetical protein EOP48_16070 [Sphingobacteriales bacterium]|nr:MAG: hypothetical protein EOP48_16070 [Sphingobacteriales bacterium]